MPSENETKIVLLCEVLFRGLVPSRRVGACVLVTTYDEYNDLLLYLSVYFCLSVKTFCFAKTTQIVKKHGQSRWVMRGAYSARPNRLAPCYLLAAGVSDKHGQTATRHLGLLTTTALPAEDTDHLILVWWQRTKRGSGPRDGSFVGGAKHGAAKDRDELPLGATRSKAGPPTGEQKTRPN